jgi:hypothetical protein
MDTKRRDYDGQINMEMGLQRTMYSGTDRNGWDLGTFEAPDPRDKFRGLANVVLLQNSQSARIFRYKIVSQ